MAKKKKDKGRMFKIRLIESKSKRPVLYFKGLVTEKDQREGKFGGDIEEDLYLSAWQIRIPKGTKLNWNVPTILNIEKEKKKKK